MKKAIITILISAAVISGVLFAEFMINSDFKDVDTVSVATTTLEEYIELTGDVKELNKREIKYDFPVDVSEIYVSIGDEVIPGQKLLSVDKSSLLNKFELAKAESSDDESYNNLITSLRFMPECLYSPIKGVISEIYATENSQAPTERPLITITDTENLVIRSKVSSDSFKEIHLGQKAYIYADDGIQEGKISKIYPTAEKSEDESLAWISFEIHPENPEQLKCGTAVNVKICSEVYNDIITVPFDSVVFDEDNTYVYVDISGFAVKKRVVLGKEFDTEVEIISGISINDKLIKTPHKQKISNGDKVSRGE